MQPALAEAEDALAACGEGAVMGDQQQGRALLPVEAEEQVAYPAAGLAIEVAGRLVGEQQRRPGHEGTSDGDTLLLASGEGARQVAAASVEPDGLQGRAHPRWIPLAAQLEGKGDVLLHREMGQQVERLEHEADRGQAQGGAPLLVELPQILTRDHDLSGAGLVEAREQGEQGGLAGAGGADDGDRLAREHLDRDPVQNADLALWPVKALAQL